MKIGNYVQYKAENGSIGAIIGTNHSIDDLFYVTWVFGRNVNNEVISSTGGVKAAQLIKITKEKYDCYRNSKAFKGREEWQQSKSKI